MVSDTLYRIAEMTAEHYRQSEDFQRSQAEHLAKLIEQIIAIIGLEPGGPYGTEVFESIYPVERILARVRELAAK